MIHNLLLDFKELEDYLVRFHKWVHQSLKTFQVALLAIFKQFLFLAFIFEPKHFKECLAI